MKLGSYDNIALNQRLLGTKRHRDHGVTRLDGVGNTTKRKPQILGHTYIYVIQIKHRITNRGQQIKRKARKRIYFFSFLFFLLTVLIQLKKIGVITR